MSWIVTNAPLGEQGCENPPYVVQDKTKFPKEPHHVFDEVAHSRPA